CYGDSITHKGAVIAGTGVWTGRTFEAGLRRHRQGRSGSHAPARSTKSRTAGGNSWSNSVAQLRTWHAMSALTSRAQPSAVLKATTRKGCRYWPDSISATTVFKSA